jgi:DNA mismatch repair protein MutS
VASGELLWSQVSDTVPEPFANTFALLEQINPAETLVSEVSPLRNSYRGPLTTRPPWEFDAVRGAELLKSRLGVMSLAAYELEQAPLALRAISALIAYAEKSQGRALTHLRAPQQYRANDTLIIDSVARRTLELVNPLFSDATPQATLLSALDRCVSAAGSRKLRQWVTSPLRHNTEVAGRHGAIKWLIESDESSQLIGTLRAAFSNVSDISRIAGRISLRNIRPRECLALRQSLVSVSAIHDLLAERLQSAGSAQLQQVANALAQPDLRKCEDLLVRAIDDQCSLQIRDGGVIRTGYDPELDEYRSLQADSGAFLLAMEMRERERTGIANLKVGFNAVHGYYIEITAGQLAKTPDDYQRRQTLKNAERFITPELKAFEEKALSANDRALAREKVLFDQLLDTLDSFVPQLQTAADVLSNLDCWTCLASFVTRDQWILPTLSANPEIKIVNGRHPMLALTMPDFTPNDTILRHDCRMQVITGPNMGGKSTYMRQVALIAILARMGSPVPAQEATVGELDRIFTRIGAADDLAGGRSTFMVEMTEAAMILHQATEKSLVLMDEIGRGTSTSDGLALAWAIAQSLAQTNRCLTLFATHYFELTALDQLSTSIVNVHVGAVEHEHSLVFLHKVEPGPASQSFGIQVAKLAGLPESVMELAKEKQQQFRQTAPSKPQLTLF